MAGVLQKAVALEVKAAPARLPARCRARAGLVPTPWRARGRKAAARPLRRRPIAPRACSPAAARAPAAGMPHCALLARMPARGSYGPGARRGRAGGPMLTVRRRRCCRQAEFDKAVSERHDAQQELQDKLLRDREPLLKRRAELVTGKAQPTAAELEVGPPAAAAGPAAARPRAPASAAGPARSQPSQQQPRAPA
jgi:hypothetical protein